MKYLNLAVIVMLAIVVISCGGEKANSNLIEIRESIDTSGTTQSEDMDIMQGEVDESDYLEFAMKSLEANNPVQASADIMKAVALMQSYLGEAEDDNVLNSAISELSTVGKALASGTKMTSAELEKKLMEIEYFASEVEAKEGDFVEDEE